MTADFSILGCDTVSLDEKMQSSRRIPVHSRSTRASCTCLTLKTTEIRYFVAPVTTRPTTRRYIPETLYSSTARFSARPLLHTVVNGTCAAMCLLPSGRHCLIFCHRRGQSHIHIRMRVPSSDEQQCHHKVSFLYIITLTL